MRQEITEGGEQLEHHDEWDPSRFMTLLPNEVIVQIEGRDVKVKSWLYKHQGLLGGEVPILFLDTDVEGNSPDDRRITDYLYGAIKDTD